MDREKVIEGLEKVWDAFNHMEHELYADYVFDALALLKKQEAVEPTSYMDGLVQRFACGKCGKHLLYAKWGRDDFCSKCGQAVKWE